MTIPSLSTKEGRDKLREAASKAMVSALDEYCPSEFWLLLDYIEELEDEIAEMLEIEYD